MATTHTGTGAGVQTQTHCLTWPLLALSLTTLVIYMSGLAAVQNMCSSVAPAVAAPFSTGAGVFAMSGAPWDCHRLYRFYWFSWAFVLATLLGIGATLFCKWGLHNSRPFWIGMLTISTVLMMIASEAFLALAVLFEGDSDQSDQGPHRLRTTTAGAIMTIPFLIGLMLSIGTNWECRADGVCHNKPGTALTGANDPAVTSV